MGWKDTVQEAKSSWKDTIQEEPKSLSESDIRTEEPKSSTLEAAIGGIGQGGSFGFGDEISGALGATIDPLVYGDEGKTWKERYIENRDYSRKYKEKLKEEHPTAYTGGEIGGAIATSVIPGGQAKWFTRLGRGAVEGATYGLGESEADLTKGEYGEATKDAFKGAGMGVLASGAGEALQYGGSKLADTKFYKGLEEKVTSQRLRMSPSDLNKIDKQRVRLPDGKVSNVRENLPTFLKQEGFHPLSTFEGMRNKIDTVKVKAMNEISSVAKEFDSEMDRLILARAPKDIDQTLPPELIAKEIRPKILKDLGWSYDSSKSFTPKVEGILSEIRGVPGYEAQVSKIEKFNEALTNYTKDGIDSLEKLQTLRRKVDDLIKDHTLSTDKMSAYEETLSTLRRDISEHIREKMLPAFDAYRQGISDKAVDSLRERLLENNYKYAMASSTEDLLIKGEGRVAKNRVMTLTDIIAGAGGLAHSGPIGAGAAYLGKKGLELTGQTVGLYAPEIAKYTPIKQIGSGVEMLGKGVNFAKPAITQQSTQEVMTHTYESMKSDPKYGQLLQDPQRAPMNHYLLMQKDEEYRKRILGGQK